MDLVGRIGLAPVLGKIAERCLALLPNPGTDGADERICLVPVLGNVAELCLALLLIAGLDGVDERICLVPMIGKVAELCLALLLIAGLDGADGRICLVPVPRKVVECCLALLIITGLDSADLDDPLRVLFAVNSGPVENMRIRTSVSKVILFFICVNISWSAFKIKVNKIFLK